MIGGTIVETVRFSRRAAAVIASDEFRADCRGVIR